MPVVISVRGFRLARPSRSGPKRRPRFIGLAGRRDLETVCVAPPSYGRTAFRRPGFGGNRGGNEVGANRVSAWLLLSARVVSGIEWCAGNSR